MIIADPQISSQQ